MSYDLIDYIDTPETPASQLRLVKLLQPNNSEVVRGGLGYIEGAQAGDWLVPRGGNTELFRGSAGLATILVYSNISFAEWSADRGSGPPIHHPSMPPGAEWRTTESGRRACLMPNGNRVEKTAYLNCIVEGELATFAFKPSALTPALSFAKSAEGISTKIDGRDYLVVGAKWSIGTRLESNDLGQWFLPTFRLLGKLGEPKGPTLEEARRARDLRVGLKREAAEAAALAAPAATPALSVATPRAPAPEAMISPPRAPGKATFTTGHLDAKLNATGGQSPRAPGEPRGFREAPPIERYDGPDDDLPDSF